MKQAHIFVLGFVQGVGFRKFIKRKATDLGLVGWVKNTKDGRVEIVAKGPSTNIELLIKVAEKGNMISFVKSVAVEWQEAKGEFSSFEIIR